MPKRNREMTEKGKGFQEERKQKNLKLEAQKENKAPIKVAKPAPMDKAPSHENAIPEATSLEREDAAILNHEAVVKDLDPMLIHLFSPFKLVRLDARSEEKGVDEVALPTATLSLASLFDEEFKASTSAQSSPSSSDMALSYEEKLIGNLSDNSDFESLPSLD